MYVAYVDENGDLVEYETDDEIPAYEYDDDWEEKYEWED